MKLKTAVVAALEWSKSTFELRANGRGTPDNSSEPTFPGCKFSDEWYPFAIRSPTR